MHSGSAVDTLIALRLAIMIADMVTRAFDVVLLFAAGSAPGSREVRGILALAVDADHDILQEPLYISTCLCF